MPGSHERYGYRINGGEYAPDRVEQAVIAQLRDLRDRGDSWHIVAERLNMLETAAPPSGTLWTATAVELIYLRESAAW